MGVWGNHSPTMYPDLFHAQVRGEQAAAAVDDQVWIEEDFLPNVGKRGAAIIEARGSSSAASAANAAIDHVYDWVNGTEDWVSMGVASDGSYGVPEGLICGFPCTCADGEWSIVRGPRHRRVLTRQDRRLGGRADRRARHGQEPGLDLGKERARHPCRALSYQYAVRRSRSPTDRRSWQGRSERSVLRTRVIEDAARGDETRT